jgi:hypothetical protein
VWIGLTLALGDFTIIGAVAFGLFTACFFAVLPSLARRRRSAKPS